MAKNKTLVTGRGPVDMGRRRFLGKSAKAVLGVAGIAGAALAAAKAQKLGKWFFWFTHRRSRVAMEETLRKNFEKWKGNASFTVLATRHASFSKGNRCVQIADEAEKAGRPFHMLILESADMIEGKREAKEAKINSRISELRRRYAKDIADGRFSSVKSGLKDIFKPHMHSRTLEFHVGVLLAAVKHGLVVKFAEEYSPGYLKRLDDLYGKTKRVTAPDITDPGYAPTSAIRMKIAEGAAIYRRYIVARDNAMLETTPKAVAEVRRDNPGMRERKVRALVVVGTRHYGVAGRLSGKGSILVSDPEYLYAAVVDISLSQGHAFDSNLAVSRATLASFVHNAHRAYLESDPARAERLFQRLSRLSLQEADSILSKLENRTFVDRAERAEALLLGK
ncbi:MAG: hypothetical protein V1676_05845 [Candidatus Diapherotrites archaeon]